MIWIMGEANAERSRRWRELPFLRRGDSRIARRPSLPLGGLCPKRRRRRIKRGHSQAAARLPWPNGPGNRMPQRGQEVARPKAMTDEGATPTDAGRIENGNVIPRRGGAYPKGTGSTGRSCFAVCRWRCSARTPPGNTHQFVGADDSVRPVPAPATPLVR